MRSRQHQWCGNGITRWLMIYMLNILPSVPFWPCKVSWWSYTFPAATPPCALWTARQRVNGVSLCRWTKNQDGSGWVRRASPIQFGAKVSNWGREVQISNNVSSNKRSISVKNCLTGPISFGSFFSFSLNISGRVGRVAEFWAHFSSKMQDWGSVVDSLIGTFFLQYYTVLQRLL